MISDQIKKKLIRWLEKKHNIKKPLCENQTKNVSMMRADYRIFSKIRRALHDNTPSVDFVVSVVIIMCVQVNYFCTESHIVL